MAEIALRSISRTLTAAEETKVGIRNQPVTEGLEVEVVRGIGRPPRNNDIRVDADA